MKCHGAMMATVGASTYLAHKNGMKQHCAQQYPEVILSIRGESLVHYLVVPYMLSSLFFILYG